ncbi:ankyrin repeat-containing domain protein, partial [Hyaloscypha finlandica]
GRTLLYLATWKGHVKVIKLLLGNGANMAAAGPGGWTPLHLAIWKGHIKVIKLLSGSG